MNTPTDVGVFLFTGHLIPEANREPNPEPNKVRGASRLPQARRNSSAKSLGLTKLHQYFVVALIIKQWYQRGNLRLWIARRLRLLGLVQHHTVH
jgi:hypothetical protein